MNQVLLDLALAELQTGRFCRTCEHQQGVCDCGDIAAFLRDRLQSPARPLTRQSLTADNAHEMLDDMQAMVDAGKRFAIRWGAAGHGSRELLKPEDSIRLDGILAQMDSIEEIADE